jgi:hypothetical protein
MRPMGLNKGVPKQCGRVQTDKTQWLVYAKPVTYAEMKARKEGRCGQSAHIIKKSISCPTH